MILCDSNVWLALAVLQHPFHASALRWFESITEPSTIFFCRATQQSFLRLLTNSAVLSSIGNPPLSNLEAWTLYDMLLADDRIDILHREPAGLDHSWKSFSARDTASPKLWMDAYLAAFALSGGYRFATTDRAFSQFAGLDLVLLTHLEFPEDKSSLRAT